MSLNIKPNDLKHFIMYEKKPVILKNILKWNMLNWTLEDWKSVLQNENLQFRYGFNQPTEEPQWERKTNTRDGDFNYFLTQTQNNEGWLYFDYKQLNTWFKNNEKLRREIDWSPLGFPNIKPEDCTIWIGSKGAHTPCHRDCYGFNLVYQIYGKKLWLLFPSEENLKPTRLPYEESSVYSKLNFFSPNLKDFKGLDNKCRKVELNPGDVLLVPHKWWHYVENLETSISINVWCPSIEDDEERLQESIVQFFIKQMTMLSPNKVDKILNPNMDELILKSDTSSFLDTLIKCKRICTDKKIITKVEEDRENTFGQYIPLLTREEFVSFLEKQNSRFNNAGQSLEIIPGRTSDCLDLIEALTNPEVINLIKNILLKNKS